MESMTGFGRAIYENEGRNYTIEIKTVNNKYSDILIKIPKKISWLEEKIRKQISQKILRGKVDIVINFIDYTNEDKDIVINRKIANEYIKQLKEIANENEIPINLDLVELLNLPDIINVRENENSIEIEKEVLSCLEQAIDNIINMRRREGENIRIDLIKRINKIENIVINISNNTKNLVDEYILKLQKKVKEILNEKNYDENRIAQEAVIYADKISIEEEIIRLKSHIEQIRDLMNEQEKPIGKKMDFIIQEMNRETNTIGSKSGDKNITNYVIDLKMELEDIREQIQNIE